MLQLHDKGSQQALDIALGDIIGVEVIKRDQIRLGLSGALDVLDDGGAYQQDEFSITGTSGKLHT